MPGLKQQNKAHKPGRRAGLSARQKHKAAKEAQTGPAKATARGALGRQQRHNTAKQLREHKRAELLAEHRSQTAPTVAALLPLSQELDQQDLWAAVVSACHAASCKDSLQTEDMQMADAVGITRHTLQPMDVLLPGQPRQRFTLLPPLPALDALSIVDMGRAADIIVLAMPGGEGANHIDAAGLATLAVLRSLGLPTLVAVAVVPADASLKDRAQAKKAVGSVLATEVPGDHKVLTLGGEGDAQQLLRHLAVMHPTQPLWRRQRPSLLVQAARIIDDETPGACSLMLQGYVRNMGLSASQLLHLPLAGDVQMRHISSHPQPPILGRQPAQKRQHPGTGSEEAMEASGPGAAVLAAADPSQQEPLERENQADPLAGDQTWPTEEELMDSVQTGPQKQRRLPRGTSEYQAAWILDDAFDEEDYDPPDTSQTHQLNGTALGPADPSVAGDTGMSGEEDPDDDLNDDNLGSEMDIGSADASVNVSEMRRRWRSQQDDAEFPDEVDTPTDVPARQRFAKYRGLKSWRTSPWDPLEALPRHYARIFAFKHPKRTHNRAAKAQEEAVQQGKGVATGMHVEVCVPGIPREAAAQVCARVQAFSQGTAAPLVARGLLQHETKLSVLNFAIRKAPDANEPIANKSTLLLCTGLRTWEARGMLSTDEPGGDKHKMERFLHAGRQCVLSVIGPLAFGPLPLLAFQRDPAGHLQLVASGSLRGCDPNRVVLKKIVLSGYPVRVHKGKGVVRWMFHTAEDVRWFRPLGLWTKRGRHGHIKEPVGTHGAMKCIFDAPLSQQDVVCTSLYKRVFPEWPAWLQTGEAWF